MGQNKKERCRMNLHEELLDITSRLDSFRKKYVQATDDTSACDRIQQDLLHEMEFVSEGYHETAKIGVTLREVRVRRREAKDTQMIYKDFYDLTNDGQYKHIVSQLNSVARKSKSKLDGLDRRKYEKREK